MTREALLAEILRLPPEERIELLRDAWDAIAASPHEVPMPAWHAAVLEKRPSEPHRQYLSWDEVRERLKESL
jgi:putative addiction module component (TIGR02574 family)